MRFFFKKKLSPGDLVKRKSTGTLYYVLDRKKYQERWIILISNSKEPLLPVWDFENIYEVVQESI
jgi:hypothetical protein